MYAAENDDVTKMVSIILQLRLKLLYVKFDLHRTTTNEIRKEFSMASPNLTYMTAKNSTLALI